jgi:hypothetical protein
MVNLRGNVKADELKKKIEENKIQRIKEYEAIQRKIDGFIETEKMLSSTAENIIDKISLSESTSPEFIRAEESKIII